VIGTPDRRPVYLTAWVFLPDHWHAICAPLYPASISLVIKSVKQSSMSTINRGRGADGELWQPRFFDRALRTVQEYSEKGGVYPPEPRQGSLGAAAAGLAMVELQRVFGHERGWAKTTLRFDHRPRENPSDPRTRI
jgi:hypothetical protein